MTHQTYGPAPKRKLSGAAVFGIVIACLLVVCCSGVVIAAATGGKPKDKATTITTVEPTFESSAPVAIAPSTKAKPGKPVVKIEADTLVHVGEDVPAGTYRVPESVDGDCYWMKSTDSEGGNIIANDIVQGGRPQVSLKAGQWFTSQRCGEWIKK